jgi:hypothetical protein
MLKSEERPDIRLAASTASKLHEVPLKTSQPVTKFYVHYQAGPGPPFNKVSMILRRENRL